MVEALEAVGLRPTKEYIWRRLATIAECIVKCPISELSMGAYQMLVLSRFMQWRDKDITQE